MGQNIIMANP
jgi:hypothetical protein